MAGRGRGRGKTMSFNVEMLGFGRGDALPAPVQQPRPLYPPQIFKPVPLIQGEEYDYMLDLKQEFRGAARKSPYFLNLTERKRDVERYSDKYQLNQQDNEKKWEPDWRRFPSELKPVTKRKKVTGVKPNIKKNKLSDKEKTDINKKLEGLEKDASKIDVEEDEGKEEKKGDGDDEDDDEGEEVDVEDDEQLEEETDYAQSYFDNGEGFGDDEEEADEGPVY